MAYNNRVPRVLLTKSILDHHDRGVKYVAQLLRDNRMEVIYTEYGLPEEIVSAAVQEAVDVIGISFFSGGQVKVTQRVLELMKKSGIDTIPVFVGGTISAFDIPKLEALSIKGIFRVDENLAKFVDEIRDIVGR